MYDVHTTSSAQDRVVGGKVDPPPPSSTCEHVQVGADVTGGARCQITRTGFLSQNRMTAAALAMGQRLHSVGLRFRRFDTAGKELLAPLLR